LLLVEDSPDDARLFMKPAEDPDHGRFAVRHVATLRRALDEIEAHPPEIVVLDLDLPDSNGVETLRRVLAATAGIPVVVLSGRTDERDALEAVHVGASRYLVKGAADIASVLGILRLVVEGKSGRGQA
jgi:DNA-binding response OmpR family regulator